MSLEEKVENLENKVENSEESKGVLSWLGRSKWLRRSVLPVMTASSILWGSRKVEAGLKADFNGNGVVDFPDFVEFVGHYGTKPGDLGWNIKYDLDGNREIGFKDFLMFAGDFGKSSKDVIVSTGKTDYKGEVSFSETENPEPVVVKIVNESTGKAVSGLDVSYLDGNNSEVFVAYDPNKKFLPTLGIFPHNSRQTLSTVPVSGGLFKLQTINDEAGMRALLRFENTAFHFPEHIDYIYEETIGKDEGIKRYEEDLVYIKMVDLSTHFFSVDLPVSIEELSKHLHPYGEGKLKEGDRFDVYRVKKTRMSGMFKATDNPPGYIEVVRSNKPSVEVNEPKVEGNKVTLSWEGSDKTHYDKPFSALWGQEGLEARADVTVLLGRSKGSDLDYSYRVLKNGDVVREGTTTQTSITLEGLVDGNYNLETFCSDEVGNESGLVNKIFGIGKEIILGKIAFIAASEIARNLYVIQAEGHSAPKAIAEIVNVEAVPVWSPDASKIAFEELYRKPRGGLDEDIFIVNVDGSGSPVNITKNIEDSILWSYMAGLDNFWSYRVWSSDSRKIVFVNTRILPERSIYMVNVYASEDSVRIVEGGYYGAWSPDGDRMVVVLKEGMKIVNMDGSSSSARIIESVKFNSKPVFSPNGKNIAYLVEKSAKGIDVYVVDTKDFENPLRIAYVEEKDQYDSKRLIWSPDGKKIAFEIKTSRDPWPWPYELYVVNADGSNLVNITKGRGRDIDSAWSWSPDGKKIAFEYRDKNDAGIYIADSDGSGEPVHIARWEATNHSWSPDSSRLCYTSYGGIYIIKVDGSGEAMNIVKRTENPIFQIYSAVWSPK